MISIMNEILETLVIAHVVFYHLRMTLSNLAIKSGCKLYLSNLRNNLLCGTR